MKRIISLLFVALAAFILVPTPALAKRAAPKRVPTVVANSVEYSAPCKLMGGVVATDSSSRKELWRVRIYTVPIAPALERDVQDVFITSLAPGDGALLITNEKYPGSSIPDKWRRDRVASVRLDTEIRQPVRGVMKSVFRIDPFVALAKLGGVEASRVCWPAKV